MPKRKIDCMGSEKKRAPRNRTLNLSAEECADLSVGFLRPEKPCQTADIVDRIICGDLMQIIDWLPEGFVDLLILDPPYNLDKNFHGFKFSL